VVNITKTHLELDCTYTVSSGSMSSCVRSLLAGQGGDFNGNHGAYGNANTGLGNDGCTMDFFAAAGVTGVYTEGAGSSRFNSDEGYDSY
jgi:hypothetical protein